MPLLEGGMTTRRSGLRLFIPRLPPPGGGGDFVGMTLPKPFPPPVVPSRLGEAREFTKPFPEKKCKQTVRTEAAIQAFGAQEIFHHWYFCKASNNKTSHRRCSIE